MESSPRKLFPAFGTPSKVATSGNILRKPGGLAGRDTGLIPASRALQTTPPPAQGDAAIQVIVRVRPRNNREANLGGATCLQSSEAANTIRIVPPAEPHAFAFDHVASETASQSKIYELAGRPIVANCLKGMNGCLMAYGQTGSGKTYTMQGPDDGTMQMQSTLNQQGGLIQRVFEHLFEAANADSDLQTTVSCSFLEIYNETICDLLAPSFSTGKPLRSWKESFHVPPLRCVFDIQKLLITQI
jgi:kinesin family member 15